jgi:hypothetical protein
VTRVWLGVALAIGLTAAGFLGYRTAYQAGYGAGSAVVTSRWDSDKARVAEAAAEALRASHEAHRRELARREEVERGLEARLAAADTRGRDLTRRLRHALGSAGACAVPKAGAAPSGADGAPREPGDPAEVGEALAAHLSACERDAERFGELQRWLTP